MPARRGIPSVMNGTKAIRVKTNNSASKNGKTAIDVRSIEVLAIGATIKRTMPKGGVITPSNKPIIKNIPY